MKKEWKWKNVTVTLEKIKPNWKVAIAWIIALSLIAWLIWFR
ncbi:hypothetical protein P7D46_05550 [Enterococcus dongliensis]|nr:hypothetical protein [Enterococcus dongliensis]